MTTTTYRNESKRLNIKAEDITFYATMIAILVLLIVSAGFNYSGLVTIASNSGMDISWEILPGFNMNKKYFMPLLIDFVLIVLIGFQVSQAMRGVKMEGDFIPWVKKNPIPFISKAGVYIYTLVTMYFNFMEATHVEGWDDSTLLVSASILISFQLAPIGVWLCTELLAYMILERTKEKRKIQENYTEIETLQIAVKEAKSTLYTMKEKAEKWAGLNASYEQAKGKILQADQAKKEAQKLLEDRKKKAHVFGIKLDEIGSLDRKKTELEMEISALEDRKVGSEKTIRKIDIEEEEKRKNLSTIEDAIQGKKAELDTINKHIGSKKAQIGKLKELEIFRQLDSKFLESFLCYHLKNAGVSYSQMGDIFPFSSKTASNRCSDFEKQISDIDDEKIQEKFLLKG